MFIKRIVNNKRITKNPPFLLFIMYIYLIVIGTVLLMLPISSATGEVTGFIDALFTATSALCVTGLTTVTTASHWNTFGHVVIIVLIQLGGLGVMTAAGSVALILKRRISVTERIHLAEEKNAETISGMVKLMRYILRATFIIEGIGAILLASRFIPDYGLGKGLWFGVFHSIAAFCNAGFDIIGDASVVPYVDNIIVSTTIILLILFGGLGYGVYRDVVQKKKFKKLTLHTKIVIVTTLAITLGGALITLLLEWSNPETMANLSLKGKILASFFQVTTSRTAGFFSISQGGMRQATALLTIVIMFIGGSPAGTAGGIKTTTVAMLLLVSRSSIKQAKDITTFRRRIPNELARKATTIFIVAIVFVLLVSFVLTIIETDKDFLDILFEVTSAFSTTGLTRGITTSLTTASKVIIAATMLFGKLGPLTMMFAFTTKETPKAFREAEESIIVG